MFNNAKIKLVEGFRDYLIFSNGEVFSRAKGKFLSPSKNSKGYSQVELWKNGVGSKRLVHRLVAQAFIPNPENKSQINHKNSIRHCNLLDNLEWVTGRENIQHAYALGRMVGPKGSKSAMSKLNDAEVMDIKQLLAEGVFTQTYIAKLFGVSPQTISAIHTRHSWGHLKAELYEEK